MYITVRTVAFHFLYRFDVLIVEVMLLNLLHSFAWPLFFKKGDDLVERHLCGPCMQCGHCADRCCVNLFMEGQSSAVRVFLFVCKFLKYRNITGVKLRH